MNTKNTKTRKIVSTKNRRKLSLLLSVLTVFSAVFVLGQLMFSPNFVQPVYAGSTLTPTSVPAPTDPPPTNTPVPAPTNTPPPAATNTPIPPTEVPSTNTGGSNNSQPTPTATPEPIPQEIPELGVGSTWGPLFLTLSVLLIALGLAMVQIRYLLSMPSD